MNGMMARRPRGSRSRGLAHGFVRTPHDGGVAAVPLSTRGVECVGRAPPPDERSGRWSAGAKSRGPCGRLRGGADVPADRLDPADEGNRCRAGGVRNGRAGRRRRDSKQPQASIRGTASEAAIGGRESREHPNPEQGRAGDRSERGDPPRSLGQRPGGDQSIEAGRPGPRGVRPRRDVVRAAGAAAGGTSHPTQASTRPATSQPGGAARRGCGFMRTISVDRAGHIRLDRTWVGCRSAFGDGSEHSTLYPGTIPIASVTVAFEQPDREARPGTRGGRRSPGPARIARGRPMTRRPSAIPSTAWIVGAFAVVFCPSCRQDARPGPAEPLAGCAGRPPGGRELPGGVAPVASDST